MSYSVKSTWNDGWDLALRTVGCYYKCPSVPDSVSDGRKTEAMWSQWTRSRRPGQKLMQSRGLSQEGTFFCSLGELNTVFSPFLMMLGQWRDSSLMEAQCLMALTSQSFLAP